LKELIENKFSRKTFESYVKDNFNLNIKKGLLEDNIKKSNDKEDTNIKSYQKIATMTKANKDDISFFVFESKTKNIINKRVGYSDFIKKLSTKYEFDGAVVAIYHPDSDVWRLSFVSVEFTDNNKTKLQTIPKRYTFELGDVPHKTALEQLSILDKNSTKEDFLKAFSVEKLSDDFFKEYKKIYYIVLNILKPEIALFENKNKNKNNISYFTKKLLGRIIFLYFLQKKGWLGSKETWGDGDKKFISNGFENYKNNNFYKDILQPIFFEALNTKRKDDYFELLHCKMPFLNGGLFSKDEFDDETLLSLDNIVFEDIFKLFDSYNFTIIEDTLNDKEVAIDPEMLGRIFEDLLEDRKDKGAFYTPREIVHYMCQQSIINYLSLSFDESEAIEQLVLNQKTDNSYIRTNAKKIQQKLKHIKVLDPAIGSGAFPMGMLHEIVQILSNIDKTANIVELKKQVIQDSIYGIDIETSAVEIAKLRFWLSIVVDDEVPTPLPNLFYKIMVGNSLIETVNGFDPFAKLDDGNKGETTTIDFDDADSKTDKIQKLIRQYFDEPNKDKKQKIQDNIDKNIKNIFDIKIAEYKNEIQTKSSRLHMGTKKEKTALQKSIQDDMDNLRAFQEIIKKPPTTKLFFYKLYFADVIDGGGFDVVIGNPPYIREKNIKELKNNIEQIHKTNKQNKTIAIYQNEKIYLSYNGTADIYVYFIEKGYQLLKKGGVLSYITSNKYTRAKYGKQLREFLLSNTNISGYIDFNGVKVFPNATVDTSILSFSKRKENIDTGIVKDIKNHNTFIYCNIDKTYKKGTELNQFISDNGFEYSQDDLSVDSFAFATSKELEIKNQIEKVGIPLKDWDIKINYGIKTGYNEAFIIDTKTKDELIKQDKNSADIIKPLLRGRDIKKYEFKFADKWIIGTFPSLNLNIDNYPAIKDYLLTFGKRIYQIGGKESRKKTTNKWFETQDTIAYLDEFNKEKIIWIELCDKAQFTLDYSHFGLAGTWVLTGSNIKYILSILNSKASLFYFDKIATSSGVGTNMWKKYKIELLPIPQITKEAQKLFEVLVDKIMNLKAQDKDTTKLENEIDAMVYRLYGLSDSEIDIVEGSL